MVRRKRREVVEAVRNEKILASGRPLEPQMRTEPRTEVNARIDPYKIRPGAYKMVLPPEEESKLTLVRAQVPMRMCPQAHVHVSVAACFAQLQAAVLRAWVASMWTPAAKASRSCCCLCSLQGAWRLHGVLWHSQSPCTLLDIMHKWQVPTHPAQIPVQDQFGTGIQLSPKWPWGYLFGGKEDFVFGIFGRTDHARAALARRWASARRLRVLLSWRSS